MVWFPGKPGMNSLASWGSSPLDEVIVIQQAWSPGIAPGVLLPGEQLMNIALLIARLVLAVVFVVAGLTKLADRAGSRQTLIDFGVPARLATPGGLLLPLAELAV